MSFKDDYRELIKRREQVNNYDNYALEKLDAEEIKIVTKNMNEAIKY